MTTSAWEALNARMHKRDRQAQAAVFGMAFAGALAEIAMLGLIIKATVCAIGGHVSFLAAAFFGLYVVGAQCLVEWLSRKLLGRLYGTIIHKVFG